MFEAPRGSGRRAREGARARDSALTAVFLRPEVRRRTAPDEVVTVGTVLLARTASAGSAERTDAPNRGVAIRRREESSIALEKDDQR